MVASKLFVFRAKLTILRVPLGQQLLSPTPTHVWKPGSLAASVERERHWVSVRNVWYHRTAELVQR
jgi:hypothetical protein